jgi:hypothetical protein
VLGAISTDAVSASLALVAFQRWPLLTLRAGVGARAGAARVTGSAADDASVQAGSVAGFWWGPTAVISASFTPVSRLVIEIGAEGGLAVTRVRGHVGEGEDAGVTGPWFGGTFGIGLAP